MELYYFFDVLKGLKPEEAKKSKASVISQSILLQKANIFN